MASPWSSCSILFAALLCARAVPLQDDHLVEKVKTIIAHADDYLATHGMNELLLPNIGISSFDPVKLRNGGFGQFSTIYVQDATSVNKTQEENDTLYSFNIKLGLKVLKLHYDYHISAVVLNEKGNFNLTVLKNSALVTGTVTIQSSKVCKAKLASVKVLELGDYRIELPEDDSAIIIVSEVILNAITPKLLPLLNKALRAALLVPGAQNVFSAIACSQLS